jgi:protein-S-isoprenylcysteine O-methyltransferase Ste14
MLAAEPALNVLWAVWYVSWIVAAAWAGRTKTQMKTDRGGLHRFVSMIGVLLLFAPLGRLVTFGPVFHLAVGRLWPLSQVMGWTLFALAASGFAFCWWARLHLGKLWSGFVTLKEDHRIVDTGPYALVRHPIYSGVMFAALMTGLMRANPAALLGAMLIVAGFAMTARIEEGFLRAQLGPETYDGYRRRVAMLMPRLRFSRAA